MKLIPAVSNTKSAQEERLSILKRIAKLLKTQGNFKLGAKIYTMANEKMKGIKCLLKSGDAKAVIGYASNARQSEVYILAGNFL